MRIGNRSLGRFFVRISIVALILLLSACASTTPNKKNFHVVREGETLYAISWRYGYDLKEVARWNGFKPPYTLSVGQLVRISPPTPVVTAQGSTRKPAPVVDNRKPKPKTKPKSSVPKPKASTSKPKPKAVPRPKSSSKPKSVPTTTKFGWPLKGKVVSGFSASNRGNQGIDIAGKPGQSVHAAAGGRVVYSGQGLRQLGKLVIIKHDSRFLSAYGFNSKLLVKEGDSVRPGQKIAIVGKNNKGQHVLHFEIRRDGTPVNPRVYLR